MTNEPPRVVLDTNVFLSAVISNKPNSPAKEILQRWVNGEFTVVISEAVYDELTETLYARLSERRVTEQEIVELLANVEALAEWVEVPSDRVMRVILNDPDDDLVVACAVVGRADYLVTNDKHYRHLNGEYNGIMIKDIVHFLRQVRGGAPSKP